MSTIGRFTITAEFLSDWSIGSGQGVGKGVDSGVMRDSEGLPYLPFSSLVGLLRQMGLSVVQALGGGEPERLKEWMAWHTWLFGSRPGHDADPASRDRKTPQPAALDGSGLRLSRGIRRAIATYPTTGVSGAPTRADVVDALTLLRPGIEIGDEGKAKEDFFRVDERAIVGLKLSAADWNLHHSGCANLTDDDVWPALVILQSAAKLLKTVGGKRRRGAGEVRITLDLLDDATLGERLTGLGPLPPLPPTSSPTRKGTPKAVNGPCRHVADLEIEIHSPVIVNPVRRGNQVISDVAIPGATLLPLLRQLLDEDLATLIHSDRIRLTPAYPVVDGRRCVPWPLALGTVKHKTEKPWYANAILMPEEKVKPGGGFLIPPREGQNPGEAPDGTIYRLGVEPVGINRTSAQDAPREEESEDAERADAGSPSPTRVEQEPFSYFGIGAGMRYRAEIWSDHAIAPSGREPFQIGTARRGEYGRVKAEITAPPPESAPTNHSASSLKAGSVFTLQATSGWILHTPSGGPATSTADVLTCLKAELGDPHLELVGEAPVLKAMRGESWQTIWGLPRPTLVYIASGSVIRLKASMDLNLATAVAEGIGQRRAEGFGRVALNPFWLEGETIRIPNYMSSPRTTRVEADTSAHGNPDLEGLYQRAWSSAIVRAARSGVETWFPTLSDLKVSLAQLGDLRERVAVFGKDPAGIEKDELEERVEAIVEWFRRNGVELAANAPERMMLKDLSQSNPIWSNMPDDDANQARTRGDRLGQELSPDAIAEVTRGAVQAVYLEAIRQLALRKQKKERGRQ